MRLRRSDALSIETPRVDVETRTLHIKPEELLALVGRLDDAPGFDTPRERFRRLLSDYAADSRTSRALIESWIHSTGEQPQRALQDAVVMLGRGLGFETTFGAYQRLADVPHVDGVWRSRHRVRIVLDIRTDRTPRPNIGSQTQSASALTNTAQVDPDPEERCLRLCVFMVGEAGRRTEENLADADARGLRVASIRSLLSLNDLVAQQRLTHDEVVRLVTSTTSLDLVVDLLTRQPGDTTARAAASAPTLTPDPEPEYWLATIVRNGAATAEQLLESVVSKRHVLGVTNLAKGQIASRPGDWICFFVPGKGVVGHGRVLAPANGGANGIDRMRASDRFERLIRLDDVEIYDAAVVPAPGQQQRLAAMLGVNGTSGPLLGAISRQDFVELTTNAAIAGTLRLHGSNRPNGSTPSSGVRQAADDEM